MNSTYLKAYWSQGKIQDFISRGDSPRHEWRIFYLLILTSSRIRNKIFYREGLLIPSKHPSDIFAAHVHTSGFLFFIRPAICLNRHLKGIKFNIIIIISQFQWKRRVQLHKIIIAYPGVNSFWFLVSNIFFE